MGISKILYDQYNSFKSNKETGELKILELGDQDIIFGDLDGKKFRNEESKNFKEWISVDLHPREGVYIKDLSVSDPDFGKFDIVTNFGTSEHVEPDFGHYNCWLNIHNWTKIGGHSIHEIPEYGHWKNHCRFYYTIDFFKKFEKIGYEISQINLNYYESQGNLIFCSLMKKEECEFMSFEEFSSLIKKIDTSSELIAPENNPKKLRF